MGFGVLFFGYFITFAFSISNYYFFADIIGALIMMYAFTKLWQYNLYYKSAAVSCLAFLALCGVNAASMMFRIYPGDGNVAMTVSVIKLAAACLVHIFIFLGAKGISLGAGDGRLAKKCERQLVMSMVYYIAAFGVLVLGDALGDNVRYFSLAVLVYFIITFILNLAAIYTCFGRLCPEDEDDEAPKKSRFAIINKINEKFDSFEENSNKFRRDSMKMAREEAERLAEEKKKKYNHSKKKKKKK